MAFRLPAQVPRRRPSYHASQPASPLEAPSPISQLPPKEEEEGGGGGGGGAGDAAEWVLFAPSRGIAGAETAQTASSTDRTPRTTGATRLSDFGSFNTGPRSDAAYDLFDEDETELDSLDDGLHAFREEPSSLVPGRSDHGPPAVLPAHDGLGSFHASSQMVQEQLWRHEQFNPSRRTEIRPRRRSSVQRQLDTVAENDIAAIERERWQRIERWRMEQSRALVQEIERQTRRRRSSRASRASLVGEEPNLALPGTMAAGAAMANSNHVTEDIDVDEDSEESFWQRITRKVIRDLMGIDDTLLSVIFGESLPLDVIDEAESPPSLRRPSFVGGTASLAMDAATQRRQGLDPLYSEQRQSWQSRLFHRIARELGILMHQIYEHPGAFTTYLHMSDRISSEYAGMRLQSSSSSSLPRQAGPKPSTAATTAASAAAGTDSASGQFSQDSSVPISPMFNPTLHEASGKEHAAHWGIEDDEDDDEAPRRQHAPADAAAAAVAATAAPSESTRLQQDYEYWEREVDVMMVFRYLRNRFAQRRNPDNASSTTGSRRYHPLQDPSRRAAIIRQHHPLVARAYSRSQAQQQQQQQHQQQQHPHHHVRRPSSSCASQSARRSALSGKRTLTGSSRNYWDIGASVGSGGSATVSVGAAGAGAFDI